MYVRASFFKGGFGQTELDLTFHLSPLTFSLRPFAPFCFGRWDPFFTFRLFLIRPCCCRFGNSCIGKLLRHRSSGAASARKTTKRVKVATGHHRFSGFLAIPWDLFSIGLVPRTLDRWNDNDVGDDNNDSYKNSSKFR